MFWSLIVVQKWRTCWKDRGAYEAKSSDVTIVLVRVMMIRIWIGVDIRIWIKDMVRRIHVGIYHIRIVIRDRLWVDGRRNRHDRGSRIKDRGVKGRVRF